MSKEHIKVGIEKKLTHGERQSAPHEVFITPEKNQEGYETAQRNYSTDRGEPTHRFMTGSYGSYDEGKARKIRGAFFSNVFFLILAIGVPVAFALKAVPMAWDQFGGLGVVGVGLIALWAFLGIATQFFKSLGRYGDLTKDLHNF